jgi:putative two-component system response regulator
VPILKEREVGRMVPFSWEDKLVARLAETLALACGLSSKQARLIGDAAELHDVGKFRVPRYIIHKPGRLSPGEFEIMKSHTLWGASILSNLCGEFRTVAVNISRLHHEKWDGTGYWKYKGSEIPFYCQIAGMSDVYVALTVKRPYKEPWPPYVALDYIKKESGKTFCPNLVRVFQSLFPQNQSHPPASRKPQLWEARRVSKL